MHNWEKLVRGEQTDEHSDVVEWLTETSLGLHCLGLTVEYDDVVAVISSADNVSAETREQVLASITHIGDSGEAILYFAFCMHMAELKDVIADADGYLQIIQAIGSAGDMMLISKPPKNTH